MPRCLTSGERRVLQKGTPNEPGVLGELFGELKPVGVAMEATYAWEPVYELLERMGLEVHLARLLQLNWLPTAYVPPREVRELRRLVRLRAELVRLGLKAIGNPVLQGVEGGPEGDLQDGQGGAGALRVPHAEDTEAGGGDREGSLGEPPGQAPHDHPGGRGLLGPDHPGGDRGRLEVQEP